MVRDVFEALGRGLLISLLGGAAIGIGALIAWASAAASGGGGVTVTIGLFLMGGLLVIAGVGVGFIGAITAVTSAHGAGLSAEQRYQLGLLAFVDGVLAVISVDEPVSDEDFRRAQAQISEHYGETVPESLLRERQRSHFYQEHIATLKRLRGSIDRPTKSAIGRAAAALATSGDTPSQARADAARDVARSLRIPKPTLTAAEG